MFYNAVLKAKSQFIAKVYLHTGENKISEETKDSFLKDNYARDLLKHKILILNKITEETNKTNFFKRKKLNKGK